MKKLSLLMIMLLGVSLFAADSIKLPAPKKSGGMPLFDALANRKSTRSYSDKELDMQTLSNLLWGAYGINRPDGKRTVPSARNKLSTEVWIMTKDMVAKYNAQEHSLEKMLSGDYRKYVGAQKFSQESPLNILLIANFDRLDYAKNDVLRAKYAATDAALISQNIYLVCSSENLGTVVRGSFNALEIGKALKLKSNLEVMWIQVVGFTK